MFLAERLEKHEPIEDFVGLPVICTCGWTPEHMDAGLSVEDYTGELNTQFERHVKDSVNTGS